MPDVGAARMLSPKIVGQTRLLELRGEEESMELRTVNAVVTGGASGLGRATAERLVAAGGRVALLDPPASAGADDANPPGPSALFIPAAGPSAREAHPALRAGAGRLRRLH